MIETLFYDDGDNKANLYEAVEAFNPDVPRLSLEEAFANRNGGDPVEWIPEVEDFHRKIDEIMAQGGSVAMVSGQPEADGVFAGYYEIKILLLKESDEGSPELIVRKIYATPEQHRRGKMRLPEEGLFVLDPVEE